VIIWWLIKRFRRWREERRARQASQPPADPASQRSHVRRSPPPARVDPDAAISVRGLTKRYDGREAVRGIDFDVARGEIVAFLGPNGAGKTTTVEILEGYRTRSSGDVSVLGQDPAAAERGWRDAIGVVLQDSEPEQYLTARECVELYAGYYSRPRPAEETLALVGLSDNADTLSRALSGGQRRRLDVALALVGDPELVFLDEPTTGFDPSARRAAWKVVAGLRELGKTIFLTTHYMDEAEYLADRIVVLAHGEIVAEGTPATLGGRDRSAATIVFTLPPGLSAGALPPRFVEAAARDGGLVSVRSDTPLDDLRALTGWAAEAGVDLPDLEVRRTSLEDVYLELTGATA
jgi:ABC-2 type transport system ATP-binding protein